ncbi:MAG: class I SAM-dependent methyltransferase [Alphaproteobacteria bacterium]
MTPRIRPLHFAPAAALAALLAFTAAPALAQTTDYKPEVFQAGKDVVWVPTADELVGKMLDMAKVTKDDIVYDLGSGDGRTVIAAAKRGARAYGIEYNPDLVELSKRNAAAAGVADRATFEKADIFESDYSKATVITLFLLPSLNERLRPTILKQKPGTRVVSNTFPMGDWEPDETANVGAQDCSSWCRALLWIVPAEVAGDWRLGNQDLKLTQQYQMLSGTLGSAAISDAKMNGTEISFTAGGTKYVGTVEGKTMKGANWSATRK